MNGLTLFLPDPEATLLLGSTLGSLLAKHCGFPVFLNGEMGSGKTTLIRGIVAPLPGSEQAEVASPSFTLVNVYPTVPKVFHADLFRNPPGSPMPEELEDALDHTLADTSGEVSAPPPLILIEWPEHMPGADVPAKRLDIFLQACNGSRLFSALPLAPAARALCAELEDRVRRDHPAWLDVPQSAAKLPLCP